MFKEVDPTQQNQTSGIDPISVGATVGSNILSGIVSNLGARKRAEEAYRRQRQLIEEERAYNDPSMQMQRLKSAGINPHMAYMKGTLNNVVSSSGKGVQQAQTFAYSPKVAETMQMLQNLKQVQQNINESKSRESLNRSNKELVDKKSISQGIENFFNDYVTGYTGQAKYVTVNGEKYDSIEAMKLWLKNELTLPPRIENYFYNKLKNGVEYQTAVSNKEIAQAKAYLAKAGYTFNDDLAVRMGVMIAKSEGIDITTVQGLTMLQQTINGLMPLLTRGKLGTQRGRTKTEVIRDSNRTHQGKTTTKTTTYN